MSRTRKALLSAASLVLLAGCVSARHTMLVPGGQQPPVAEDQVTVYLQETEVPATCTRYALIHTSGDVDMTDETQMINAAKRRAGKIGANAIALGAVREPSSGRRVAAAVFGVSQDRKGQMVAYRCGDTPAAAAAPATGS
jgi:molybdopterin synthase catalytic subunit